MRRKPYTEAGIKRVPCLRCGEASSYQWNICSLPGFHGICTPCDIALNRLVLHFMNVPTAADLAETYATSRT